MRFSPYPNYVYLSQPWKMWLFGGLVFLGIVFCAWLLFGVVSMWEQAPQPEVSVEQVIPSKPPSPYAYRIPLTQTVQLGGYFPWIDSVVAQYDTLVPYLLTEQLIAHTNPWLIARFMNAGYYEQKALGREILDARTLEILHPGDTLLLPGDSLQADISCMLSSVVLEVNIPEYTLRIWENDSIRHQFLVRVGIPGKKYLPVLGREINTRTVVGKGAVVGIIRHPKFINFTTGETVHYTRRDDGVTTRMPMVPSIEPEIAGERLGQLIHATTNPETLGKMYSHGCIGTSEPAAWQIYFHLSLGTPVHFRYDLQAIDSTGSPYLLDDIYSLKPVLP